MNRLFSCAPYELLPLINECVSDIQEVVLLGCLTDLYQKFIMLGVCYGKTLECSYSCMRSD